MQKKVLILGGGFAGIYTALELEKSLWHKTQIKVTLVNRENFFLFTPMLHEVAASDLDITHIVNPIRKLLHRVNFFHGEVCGIDLATKRIQVVHGPKHHPHEMEYDYLVIALGGITNYFGIPGLRERSLAMKSLGDAIHLRNRLIDLLEEADSECAAGERKNLLTVAVVGGGFAGVETAAAVNDFLRDATRFYPHLRKDLIRTVLVHGGPLVLPELDAELGSYAEKVLARRNIHVLLNTKVQAVSEGGLELGDGNKMAVSTVVWTAGASPSPILETLPCVNVGGRLVVNELLEVPNWDGVWALGDCAFITNPRTGKPHPSTAQHAMRQGKTVARNILATIHGQKKKPFEFSTIGMLAATGRRTGVANILGFNFSGMIAWLVWRTIYLSKLPRIEKKLRVALDWTLDLIFAKDLVHFMILRSTAVPRQETNDLGAHERKELVQIPGMEGAPPVGRSLFAGEKSEL
jgi:NADH dehydrogenase